MSKGCHKNVDIITEPLQNIDIQSNMLLLLYITFNNFAAF